MVFADAVLTYYEAGWRGILPVPPGAKHPPPGGRKLPDGNREPSYTGMEGIDTDPATLAAWAGIYPDHSLALRIPRGIIALDVDHYDKNGERKRGGFTLTELETRLGALPATWASTARGTEQGAGLSRTLFYRVPDRRYRTKLPDIEILQFHHRYCVVWPSRNPDSAGTQYRWYGPDGAPNGRVPKVDEFPLLPKDWVDLLAEGAAEASPAMAAWGAGDALLAALLADDRPGCTETDSGASKAVAYFTSAERGGRHDVATERVYHLITLGAFGHRGVGTVLATLRGLWATLTGGEGREEEFDRMLLTAARKAVTAIGAAQPVINDPCELGAAAREGFAGLVGQNAGQPSAPITPPGLPGEPSAAELELPPENVPVGWSVRAWIGAHAFTPKAQADQMLAHAGWERLWPGFRYCYDSGDWLVRTASRWELRSGEMHKWAASVLGDLMPVGDPTAEKGSEAQLQAARRGKFITNGSAGSIAAKMHTLVLAGDHPCSLELSRLDTDPTIMWGGGIPWDLGKSADVPTRAAIDPATPHLHSAADAPMVAPTPHWDDFLAAVWPDPQVRAWALRVLSIGLTGYPDAALPILLGETGRGKSQVIELLMDALGTYGLAADPRLLGNTDNAHASIVIALMGRRLAFIDEGPRGGHSATERLKQLTGGTTLTGNRMRGNPVEFRPTHTLVLTTNEPPQVTDPAVARRVRLIPCTGDPEAVYDTRAAISERIWRAERPGVLAMMMSEAGRWLADRRSAHTAAAPISIRYQAADLAAAQDVVGAWIEAEMVPDQWGTKGAELHHMHAAWRRGITRSEISGVKFAEALDRLGYPKIRRKDANYRALRHKHVPPTSPPPGTYQDPSGATIQTINQHMYWVTPQNAADAELRRGPAPHLRNDQENGQNTTSADAVIPPTMHPHYTPHGGPEVSVNADPSMGAAVGTPPVGEPIPAAADLGVLQPAWMPPAPQMRNTSSGSSNAVESPPPSHDQLQDNGTSMATSSKTYADRSYSAKSDMPASGGTPLDTCGDSSMQPSTTTDQSELSNGGEMEGLEHPIQPNNNINSLHNTNGASDDPHITPISHNGGFASTFHQRDLETAPAKRSSRKISNDPEKVRAREAAKIAKAQAAAAAKAAERAAKIATAAGDLLAFPMLKTRGERAQSVSLSVAISWVQAAMVRDDGCLTVDIESNGYPVGHRRHAVRTVQLGNDHDCVVFDPADPTQADAVRLLLGQAPRLRAFSATADLPVLAFAGLGDHESMWERMEDVIIKAKLADPAGSTSDAADGLKASSDALLGAYAVSPAALEARKALFAAGGWLEKTLADTPIERSGWAQVPSNGATMVDYAASDVLDTAALDRVLPDPGAALLSRERAVQRMTARISLEGVAIDGALSRRLLAQHVAAQGKASLVVQSFGIENPGSGQQVAAELTRRGAQLPRTKPSKKFPQGQLSAANDAILPFKDAPGDLGVLVRALLEFNSHKNAISTFLKPYVALCDYGDGRARPTIYTMEADTGRMSCVRPNFQNIPREGGFRSQLLADPGELLISADFSGVELRVGAALSGDRHLLDIILADDAAKLLDPKAKSDIHWKIAQAAYGPEATKPQRYNVKRGVFGKIYGSGIAGIARTLGIAEFEAAMIVEILDDMAPALKAWDQNLRQAVKAGHVHFPTYSGRIIHLDQRMPHKAGNYCIQGTARELIVDGLLRWSQTKWGRCRLFPVHDEICVFVPADEAVEATATLVECMQTELLGVPIIAAPSAPSECWLDAA